MPYGEWSDSLKGGLAATYDSALELGGELYPALLGPDASILRREHESETGKDYRQKARLKSIKHGTDVTALALL